MPPPGRNLTEQLRTAYQMVGRLMAKQSGQVVRSLNPADIDTWWLRAEPRLLQLVLAGDRVAMVAASQYLVNHARLNGAEIVPVRAAVNEEQITSGLRVSGPVKFKTHIRGGGEPGSAQVLIGRTLAGAAKRLALIGARTTIHDTIETDTAILGYQRVTSASPCDFCRDLASRGAVYKSEGSGSLKAGKSYHDSCSCTAEPLYSR